MLQKRCLAAITDRTLLSSNWTLAQALAPAITGGVDLVILRESELPEAAYRALLKFVRDGIHGQVPLVLFDRPDSVESADGLLLDETADEIADTRRTLGPGRLLGVVVRGVEHARQAAEAGADFGLAVLEWKVPERALVILRSVCSAGALPVLAGVDPPLQTVRDCMIAGAAGVAICSPVMSAYDRTAAAHAYRTAMLE